MPAEAIPTGSFAASRALAEQLLEWMGGYEVLGMEHAELECRLDERGRQMLADQMELRALRETRLEVVAAGGEAHGTAEGGHRRPLATIFGEVDVTRIAYRHRGEAN